MDKVKRIAHVLTKMDVGGAETFIMNIYRNIDREKIQFDFIVHTNEEGYYDKEIKSLGGRVIQIPAPEKVGIAQYKKNLAKTIKDYGNFDGIHAHAHFFNGIILNVAKKCGIKVRGSHSHSSQDGANQSVIRKIYRTLMRTLIVSNATDLLSCSDKASRELYGNKEAVFIPNSVKFDLYKNTSLDLRKELNLSNEALIMGHVGSFKDVKNHRYILKVFNEVVKSIDNVHLVLVGDGELRGEIEKQISEYSLEGRVHLLGIRSDVCDIIQNFDLFIFPSKFEGLPVSLVEVQAARIRAVVSDNITKDLLFTDGLINYLSLDDFNLWVRKSIELLEASKAYDKETVIFKNTNFDVDNSVKKLSEIYLRS